MALDDLLKEFGTMLDGLVGAKTEPTYLPLVESLREKYGLTYEEISIYMGKGKQYLVSTKSRGTKVDDHEDTLKIERLIAECEAGTYTKKVHLQVRKVQTETRDRLEVFIQQSEELFRWEFPEEWFELPYSEAMSRCTEAFQAWYIPRVWKSCNFQMASGAEKCGLDRKFFRSLVNKYDGRAAEIIFPEEYLEHPYAEVKSDIVPDFQHQYFVRAMEKTNGNIALAARNMGTDRKHVRYILNGKIPVKWRDTQVE